MASEGYQDSFVIPLSKPELIEEARKILSGEVPDPGALICTLKAGGNGINRDYRRLGAPAWSWHVNEVLRFGNQGSADTVRFSATYLEKRGVARYMEVLAEWRQELPEASYRLVMELAPQLCLTVIDQDEGFVLSWPSQGVYSEYVVEGTDDLENGTWTPLPGMPMMGTELSVSKAPYTFFRVTSRYKHVGYPD